MGDYVYKRTERELWTVGFYDPNGKWQPESDHGSEGSASKRVAYLNGSSAEARAAQLEAERDQLLRHNDNLIKEVAQWRIHVEHVEAERDDLRAKLNEAMAIARGFVAERDEARRQLEQARKWARVWKLAAKWHNLSAVISFGE